MNTVFDVFNFRQFSNMKAFIAAILFQQFWIWLTSHLLYRMLQQTEYRRHKGDTSPPKTRESEEDLP